MRTAEEYLQPLKDSGVDTLVLGCTHYPLLTGIISYIMGEDVTLVSSADETAKDVYRALLTENIENPDLETNPHHEFLATGESETFDYRLYRLVSRTKFSGELLSALSNRLCWAHVACAHGYGQRLPRRTSTVY